MITFEIPGEPIAKGRARAVKRGNFIAHYTPAKTANYENLVKLIANQKMAGKTLLDGPVYLFLIFKFAPPQSWSEKKKNEAILGNIMPTVKPDIDNCIKIIGDALNGIVWGDDKQVVEVKARKSYADKPSAVVCIGNLKQ